MIREPEFTPGDQLTALENAQRSMTSVTARGARQLGLTCIMLGVVLGALHSLLHIFSPEQGLPAFFVLTGAAVLAMIGLSLGYLKVRRVLPHGFSKKYLLSLFLSIGIYALTLTLITTPMPFIATVLLGLAVALPLLIGGFRMLAR
ncbi:hypothetical protein [Glutamicibacter arilaitensis]|uniref:hypothetical protein n=1 Tax=Glutamicibacter arilaitensis TaxID=256701 RepID=UPI00384AE71A